MKHPNLTQWADWVRGTAEPAEAGALEAHLDGGCPRCAAAVATLKRVAVAAAREPGRAPSHAVRSVKAFFGLDRPERRSLWETLRLDVAFDSGLAPVPVGSRGTQSADRQLLFQSKDYALDVRVNRVEGSQDTIVVGQLLEKLGEPVAHVPAYLVADGHVAASTYTGDLGGFHMEGNLTRPLELWVFVDDERRIAVTLDRDDPLPH